MLGNERITQGSKKIAIALNLRYAKRALCNE